MKPIVRFAPSPTGFLHVGGARTAIFNWLIARKLNGKFLLRIEDTDKQRSTSDSINQIISGLEWLGLDWDEDIVHQGERAGCHRNIIQQLLDQGKAYRCFCSPEMLEQKRKLAEKDKVNKRYDGLCRNLTASEIKILMSQSKPFSIRFKIEQEEISFTDLIHGLHRTITADMDDFIIQRTDGTPVYQIAVVVDDHDMNINLVLRGDDHLSNTAKQIMIYQALGWDVPQFGHLPLIFGSDKVRLSKRHGAASVEEFKNQGILADALFNYLCLLGWNPGTELEKMNREIIIELFEIDRINNTPAVFDLQKLLWLNGKYMADMPFDQLLTHAESWMVEQGFKISDEEEERFLFYIRLMQARCKTLIQLHEALDIYFTIPQKYDQKGLQKYLFKEGAESLLSDLLIKLENMDGKDFDNIGTLEGEIRSFAESNNVSASKIIHPLRLALTGKTESAGIFELLYIFGAENVLARVKKAIDYLEKVHH